MERLTVGIAGTSKNTGKTTTMSCLMSEIKKHGGFTLGLTSIGYDGESFDNVTGLPKPRIDVWPDTIAAVAERCLTSGSAALQELTRTDIITPLGNVVICRVTAPGKLILAGANNRRDLGVVLELLRDLADITIIDGAFSRIAPMAEADCLIIATGAARTTDIPRLAQESGCIVDILSIPAMAERGKTTAISSVLSRAGFAIFTEKSAAADTICIRGVVSVSYLEELVRFGGDTLSGKRFLFADPLKLILAGDILQVKEALRDMSCADIEVGVAKSCDLLAMTVNPYYPRYRFERADYMAAYVDSEELLDSVGGSIGIPCYDVVRQGGQGLFAEVMHFIRRMQQGI